MIPLEIDISGLVAQMSFTKEEAKDFSRFVLDRLSREYMEIWETKVNTLNSTRGAYKSGMSYSIDNDNTAVFELEGKGVAKIGLMLERGANAFDIKEGFKRSPKAKNAGQPNWYLTVPFRIATAGAIAESHVFSGNLPKKVQEVAKEKGRVGIKDLPEEFQGVKKRDEINVPSSIIPKFKQEAYTHKSPIYAGVVHNDKQHHGQYGSFRRVSENSDANSWIHKGFQERDFMGKSLDSLKGKIDDVLTLARNEFIDSKFK